MAAPAHTSEAMWNFWLKFKKKEPTVKLGGTYADKPGYHNTRNGLGPGWDYSKNEFAIDLAGSGNLSGAIDLTMPEAQMKVYSARLLKAGKANDPRTRYLREFFGTINGDTVTGWDFAKHGYSSSDSSHLWHVHVSIHRGYAADPRAYDALYSLLTGESLTAYKLRTAVKKVIAQVGGKTAAPLPKPPALRRPIPAYLNRTHHVIGLLTGPDNYHGGYTAAERADVKAVQQRLQALGYAPKVAGWADGKFEAPTVEAVKKWQKATGHKQTGYVDRGAYIRLFTY